MKSGSSLSIHSGAQGRSCPAKKSAIHTSRSGCHSCRSSGACGVAPRRRATTTRSTPKPPAAQISTASSAMAFSCTGLAPRIAPSAVIRILACASWMRPANASAEKPPKTTVCTAPMRAQASIVAGSSTIMGR